MGSVGFGVVGICPQIPIFVGFPWDFWGSVLDSAMLGWIWGSFVGSDGFYPQNPVGYGVGRHFGVCGFWGRWDLPPNPHFCWAFGDFGVQELAIRSTHRTQWAELPFPSLWGITDGNWGGLGSLGSGGDPIEYRGGVWGLWGQEDPLKAMGGAAWRLAIRSTHRTQWAELPSPSLWGITDGNWGGLGSLGSGGDSIEYRGGVWGLWGQGKTP